MIPLYPKSWQRAALVATLIAIPAVGLCAWPYTVDDAFIVARYASRLAQGQGYTFNAGPPTDGVTGPLWLLPGWIATHVGLDPLRAAKSVGLLCSTIACAAIVQRLARRALGTCTAIVAASLLALQPTAGGWGVAGLETGAAMLLVTWAALAATRRSARHGGAHHLHGPAPRARRTAAWQVGSAIALLAWLRPELAPVASVLLLMLIVRQGVRAAAPALVLAFAGAASVVLFRLALFSEVLPLAVAAKPGSLANGLDYVTRGALISSGVFALPLMLWGALRGRSEERWLGAAWLAHGLAIVVSGGDWMPGFRLFAPLLPVSVWLAAVGAGRVFGRALRARTKRGAAWFAGALVLLSTAFFGVDLSTRIPEWRAAEQSREGPGRALAARLRSAASRVALVDVGFLAYASGLPVIDLGGITDPAIARLPGGHLDKRVPDAWLAERAPDAIVLHSAKPPLLAAGGRLLALDGYPVERRVARDAWVQRNFRVALTIEYAPHYHYVLLLAGSQAGD